MVKGIEKHVMCLQHVIFATGELCLFESSVHVWLRVHWKWDVALLALLLLVLINRMVKHTDLSCRRSYST